MAKLTVTDILSGYYSTQALNTAFSAVETAMEKTLSRDGTGPNQMESTLDMNNNMIINWANPISVTGFNWEGPWVAGTSYSVGDTVETNGSSYICITAHTASALFSTDIANWQTVATGVYPTQTGHADKFMQTNGTNASWVVPDATEISYTASGTGAVATTVNLGLDRIIYAANFAVGDGSTDDTTALQNAIDYAESVGGIVDGGNKFYAISSKLTIGGSNAIGFQNINLKAIAGIWPTGSDGAMLQITAATNYTATNYTFLNVRCNANNAAKTGFYISSVQAKATFINCHTWFFSEKGFWIIGNSSTSDGNNDTKFIGCTAAERLWTADAGDAFNVLASRTAWAWYVDDSADVEFIDCVGYGSLRCLVVDGGLYNGQFIGCKFWAGPTRSAAGSVTVEIINGQRLQFVGCRFDDGAVQVKTFNNQFNGCLFNQFDAAAQLQLIASAGSETAAGFVLNGNKFTGTTPTALSTTGGGSWATNKLWSIVGNLKTNGTVVTLDSWEFQSGSAKYYNGQYTFGDGSNTELFTLDGGAGFNRLYQSKTGGVLRWASGANSDAESGSDAGSNWGLSSYDDSGVYKYSPVSVNRATGQVTIGSSANTGTQVKVNTTSGTTVGAAGGASALPATPTGYITVNVNGTDRKIPYYAV